MSTFLDFSESGWDDNYDGPVWPVGRCKVRLNGCDFWAVSYCGKTLLFGLLGQPCRQGSLVFARREQIEWTVDSWSAIRADVNRAQQNEREYDIEPIETLTLDLCMSIDKIVDALSGRLPVQFNGRE